MNADQPVSNLTTPWCPNGCDELPASGVCRQCGYDGEGVAEEETLNVIYCERGHWSLRPRLRTIYRFADEESEPW